jgi:hypothetical protein
MHERRRRELDQGAGAQVELRAEALLVQRAAGDRQQRQHAVADGGRGQAVQADLGNTTSADAAQAEQQAQPLARADALADQGRGEGGQDGLQADDQRRQPGRHADLDRAPDPAQVTGLQQQPGHRHVQDASARPGRRLSSTSGSRTSTAPRQRRIRKLSGGAYGSPYLAAMKPVLQRTTKNSGTGASQPAWRRRRRTGQRRGGRIGGIGRHRIASLACGRVPPAALGRLICCIRANETHANDCMP